MTALSFDPSTVLAVCAIDDVCDRAEAARTVLAAFDALDDALPRTPGGILAWAGRPWGDLLRASSPLPSAHSRMGRGRWPDAVLIGDLPADELAVDLAALGVAYRDGLGWTRDGTRLTHDEVAVLAARVLTAACDALPEPPHATIVAGITDYQAEREQAAERLAAIIDQDPNAMPGYDGNAVNLILTRGDGIEVDLHFEHQPAAFAGMDWTAPTRTMLEHLLPTTPGDDPADVATVRSWRAALRDTAATLRNGAATRRALTARLRPLLTRSASPAAPDDADGAAFLAGLDVLASIRRADLGRRYTEAGRPGDLTDRALYALAADRWGAPRSRDGYPTFRPAAAARGGA